MSSKSVLSVGHPTTLRLVFSPNVNIAGRTTCALFLSITVFFSIHWLTWCLHPLVGSSHLFLTGLINPAIPTCSYPWCSYNLIYFDGVATHDLRCIMLLYSVDISFWIPSIQGITIKMAWHCPDPLITIFQASLGHITVDVARMTPSYSWLVKLSLTTMFPYQSILRFFMFVLWWQSQY